jgi:RNA polymerase sigma-70 factor (ECF subfamily)
VEPVTYGRRLPERGLVDHSDLQDEELMAQLRQRDVGAFETLYDRYGNLVYSVSLRVLGDVQAAEDVVQEVFLRLWRKPHHYDTARGRFVTWLMSVTRNRAIDERRSRGRRQRREALPELEFGDTLASDDSDDPAAAALLTDERYAIRQALSGLPPEQRQTIELAYFGGFTQQEISDALGQPLGTVKTRIRLGMQKLRVALEERRGAERHAGDELQRG